MQSAVSEPKSIRTILVAYNEYGRRIGETHHNSRIPDAKVEEIRDRHEYDGWNCLQIASHYLLSVNTVKKICNYQRRGQRAERWKRIQVALIGPEYLPEVTVSDLNRRTDYPMSEKRVPRRLRGIARGGNRPVNP